MRCLLHRKKGEILRGYLKMNRDTPSVFDDLFNEDLSKSDINAYFCKKNQATQIITQWVTN